MNRDFWESATVLRVHSVVATIIVLTGVAVLIGSQLKRVAGIRMTIETSSPAAVEGRVFWRARTNEQYSAANSVAIHIPSGRGRVTAFLPTHARLGGLRVEAPGVDLGAVDLVGGNGRLRAETFADLVFEPVLWPGRFPTWSRVIP